MQYGYILVDPDHPDGPQFEVIPVRQVESHFNVLKLLEINPCTNCFSVVAVDFPGPGKLNVYIKIEHPFDNLDASVFDVRAILMFQGSHEFPTSGKTISDPALGDGVLLNPDGYTALYNGSTITTPAGEFEKYFPGKLATPVVPDSDINGYKYFISDDPLNNRNAFYAGSSDVETFSLQLPTGSFVIGYAVDASMLPAITLPVDDPLTDFDINANCAEPWKVVVTEEKIGKGLTVTGGQTKLLIDVYDWQGKSTHYAPMIECPEIFNGILTGTWISDEVDYTQYEVSFSNINLAPVGKYMCLIGVIAIENNPTDTPWLDLTAYQCCSLEVKTGGDLIWVKQAGGKDSSKCYGITTLSDNSTVVTGWFNTSATFGQDEGNETYLIAGTSDNIFIARYNPDGSLAWAKQAGGNKKDVGYSVTALSDNSTVVTGRFSGYAVFGQDEPNYIPLSSAGSADIFITRYDPDGSLVWAKRAGGTGLEVAFSITALSDNSTVMTGYFRDPVTFGQGESNETVLVSSGSDDIFIARYNPDGSLAWAKHAGGSHTAISSGITALSDNSTVITGYFYDTATFGQGEPNETVLDSTGHDDIFVARYNPDGSLAWAKQAGGSSHIERGCSITALSDNSTVVTGHFGSSATFGQGEPNETVLDWAGQKDIFIARYNPDGSLAWAKQAGGYASEAGYGITTLLNDSFAITGNFSDFATFGKGEPNQTILTGFGDSDIFIARYNSDGSLAWAKQAGNIVYSGDNYAVGLGISALSDNSTVVTGWLFGSATFGQGEPNETVLHSTGWGYDIFIARFAE